MTGGDPAPPRGVGVGLVLRVVLAGVLLGWLLWLSDPRAVLQAMAGASWPPLLAVVFLVLIDRVLMAQRWFALLAPLGRGHLPPRDVILRIFFVSSFVGTFLPASVGGDAARSYALARHGVPITDALASVFLDRMLGVLSLLLMACAALWLAWDLAGVSSVFVGLGAVGTACVGAAALIFSPSAERVIEAVVSRLPIGRFRRAPERLLASIRRYAHHRMVLVRVLALSVGVQGLRIAQAALLGAALGIAAPTSAYLTFVPLIMLVMLLPITVNGLGTSQAAFVWFFSRIATPAHEAFALSVLFVGLQIVGNIPGAFLVFSGAFRTVPARPRDK